ncbi:MAG: TonB-dependent receptor plug domain-containing protein, partial [Bacteroidota bacterium]
MKRLNLFLAFLFTIGMFVVHAQTSITGTVLDNNGEAIPGANIRVKGYSDIGTISDLNGTYTLSVPAEATTLIFSFVGMQTQDVEIGGQTTINVTLENEDVGIDEVVVTALGINREEKSLGYATTSVDADEALQKTEPDMLRSLQGKIPGVNISASAGDPGGATRITIRGNSSFTGNNQPLFIVDGIPYSNDQYTTTEQSSSGGNYGTGISTLDPNSIETVTVLKGAAASAMYGSRAANGVILITTKSGTASKKGLEIEYNTAMNWEEISNLPDYQNTYGNGTNFNFVPANGSWGARFDSRDSIGIWNDYAAAFPEMGDSIPWQAYPDNVKNLF